MRHILATFSRRLFQCVIKILANVNELDVMSTVYVTWTHFDCIDLLYGDILEKKKCNASAYAAKMGSYYMVTQLLSITIETLSICSDTLGDNCRQALQRG
jgi:hypothetical protein